MFSRHRTGSSPGSGESPFSEPGVLNWSQVKIRKEVPNDREKEASQRKKEKVNFF